MWQDLRSLPALARAAWRICRDRQLRFAAGISQARHRHGEADGGGASAGAPHHLFDVVDPDQPFDCGGATRRWRAPRSTRRPPRAAAARHRSSAAPGLSRRRCASGSLTARAADATLRARAWSRRKRRRARRAACAARRASIRRRAARLHARSRARRCRALEVRELTGRAAQRLARASTASPATSSTCRVVGLDVRRAALYARLDARCRRCVDGRPAGRGARAVGSAGTGPELPPLRSIGYRAARRATCAARSTNRRRSRRCSARRASFAKRQLTLIPCRSDGQNGSTRRPHRPETASPATIIRRHHTDEDGAEEGHMDQKLHPCRRPSAPAVALII